MIFSIRMRRMRSREIKPAERTIGNWNIPKSP